MLHKMYLLNVLTNKYVILMLVWGTIDYSANILHCIVWEHPQKVSIMISVQKSVLIKIICFIFCFKFKIKKRKSLQMTVFPHICADGYDEGFFGIDLSSLSSVGLSFTLTSSEKVLNPLESELYSRQRHFYHTLGSIYQRRTDFANFIQRHYNMFYGATVWVSAGRTCIMINNVTHYQLT